MIQENLAAVQERIERAAFRSGRKPEEIALVAVTKKVSPEKILEAISGGIGHFAESYVQEALVKVPEIRAKTKAACHMIGHLQTNKAAKAVELFDVVQSVDSLKLLGFIDRKAAEIGKVQECFVEVKISGETAKTGMAQSELEKLLEEAHQYKSVKIGGIMTMAPFFVSQEQARPYFIKARKIFEKLGLKHLSMGMSGDFEVAIEEGSTMVRIGRAIFGERG